MHQAALREKHQEKNQRALFSASEAATITIPDSFAKLEEWTETEMIQGEKEIAGIYVSHNPMEKFAGEITKVSNTSVLAILNKEFRGDLVKLGGVVTEFVERKSRKGESYGETFLRGPDRAHQGFWPSRSAGRAWPGPEGWTPPITWRGACPISEETNIYLENLTELESLLKKKARKIQITVDYSQIDGEFNEKLQQKLERHNATRCRT